MQQQRSDDDAVHAQFVEEIESPRFRLGAVVSEDDVDVEAVSAQFVLEVVHEFTRPRVAEVGAHADSDHAGAAAAERTRHVGGAETDAFGIGADRLGLLRGNALSAVERIAHGHGGNAEDAADFLQG